VTCALPERRELHLGVFDISEGQYQRITRLRRDPEALFGYLAEEGIPACVNHPFSALTGKRKAVDLRLPLESLPLIEARNGMMSRRANDYAAAAGGAAGAAALGGSDAHTLASVAHAFTVVRGARNRALIHANEALFAARHFRQFRSAATLRTKVRETPGGFGPTPAASVLG